MTTVDAGARPGGALRPSVRTGVPRSGPGETCGLFRPEQRAGRGAGVPGATAPDTPVRLITTINHGGADRVRSYELPAEVWQRG
ncbi:hypothetical protein [Streptomyces sp. NPDC056192]|uniref:hypothetical protein n=1 Tax=Streptomyces sp. NPDC056192 TaxID=3345743 RepID=UPI0035DB7D02